MHEKKGIKAPSGPTFTLNNAVDNLYKNEFDIYSYDKSRINQDLWPVGESNVKTMISNFLEKKGSLYKTDRNFPSMKATSMASPYLNTGVVSSKWCLNQSRNNNYDL